MATCHFPDYRICDPACGAGGFLLAAHDYIAKHYKLEVERRLSVVEELVSVVSANLQRATRLRQSILQKAFTGNL